MSVNFCPRGPSHLTGVLCKQAKQQQPEPSPQRLRLHGGAGREAEVQCAAPPELLGDVVRKARKKTKKKAAR